jgi:hypothetical protein
VPDGVDAPSERPTPRRVPRLELALGLALGLGVLAPAAHAGDGAAAAEELFNQGRKLLTAGKVKAACPKFAESYRLDPALGSLLNLATCHQLEGRLASAWSEFREAEAQAMRAGDAARQKLAAERAAALEARLPRLVVTAPAIAGLVVARDGVELGDASLGTALPVDPGEHEVTARAPGRAPWSRHVDVAVGERASLVVPELEPRPEAAAGAPAPSSEPPPSGRRTAGFVVGGIGLAALAVGGVMIGLTADRKGVLDAHCPTKTTCDADGAQALDAAKGYAWGADIAIGAGVVGLAAGAYLLLTSGTRAAAPAAHALTLAPAAGPHGASLGLRARF